MNMAPESTQRLDFVLPDFTRHSWVSDAARLAWEPRIGRISKAWREIEWRSVIHGVRPCSLTQVSLLDFADFASQWVEFGLGVLPLQPEQLASQAYASTTPEASDGVPNAFRVAVGEPKDLIALKYAWDASDNRAIGELLGYPECCCSFFQQTWVEQRSVDTTWAMAQNTIAGTQNGTTIMVNGPPEVNILWRWLGIRAVPHLPCSFDCEPTLHLASRLIETALQLGFATEMDWIREILSWPVEWSALHGIGEVKTPILKITTRTDATACRRAVQYSGYQIPEEAASGVRFPYSVPQRLLVSESVNFRNGLQQPISVSASKPEWYHLDNGFSSHYGMSVAHQPIVELARNEIANINGSIIDFGCGNGLLLKKICEGREDLVPFGLDVKTASIEHAKQLLPEQAGQFIACDMFDIDKWPAIPRFELAIFMLGRLLEVHGDRGDKFLRAIGERCARTLLYVYPGGSTEDLSSLVEKFSLSLKTVVDDYLGMLDMDSIKN